MRVPNMTLYGTSRINLGRLTSDLNDANLVVQTGKRINSIADDPIGLTQVLGLNGDISNLDQIKRNLEMGRNWLNAGETSLTSIKDLITEAKLVTQTMSNSTYNEDQRKNAAVKINGILEEIISLANTRVNGQYLFAGTKTNLKAYDLTTENGKTVVNYKGNNDEFAIKTGKDKKLAVGHDGSKVFGSDYFVINNTNNKIDFIEHDKGLATSHLTATIANGKYSGDELATAVKNALNAASESGINTKYKVLFDSTNKKFSIREDGAMLDKLDFLWNTGENSGSNAAMVMGFNRTDMSYLPPTSDHPINFITDIVIVANANDQIDFTENQVQINAVIPSGTYTDMNSLASAIENAMEAASGIGIDYKVSYDSTKSMFTIKGYGSGLNEFGILWNSGLNAANNAAQTLGFDNVDDSTVYPTSDYVVPLITVDSNNSRIDFKELVGGVLSNELHAVIPENIYTSMDELARAVENSLEQVSANGINYTVSYDAATRRFSITDSGAALNELQLLWCSGSFSNTFGEKKSAAETLGFESNADDLGALSYSGDNDVVLISITNNNNSIDFKETNSADVQSSALTAKIQNGDYTSMADLAAAMETAMETESAFSIDYTVSYDNNTRRFTIRENGSVLSNLQLLWNSGPSSLSGTNTSAAITLGFDDCHDDSSALSHISDNPVIRITIDNANNNIDYKELVNGTSGADSCELTATITNNVYTNINALTLAIETAMKNSSMFDIDYDVSFDTNTNKISIKANSSNLDEQHILWETGLNGPGGTNTSAASVLGFDNEDDIAQFVTSSGNVAGDIFDTLLWLEQSLNSNSVDGSASASASLDVHFNNILGEITEIGSKIVRLDIKDKIIQDLNMSYMKRRISIEEADVIDAITNLRTKEYAYQSALAAASRVMRSSLVDYM